MKTSITIRPRYQETDKMGVIHHSVYPVWYEMGRVDFCDKIGYPFHRIEEEGIMQAMIELTSRYIKPTVFGKTYTLTTKVATCTKVKLVFSYELHDEDGVLVHTGTTLLAWLGSNFQPINVAKHHPEIYQKILDAYLEEQ